MNTSQPISTDEDIHIKIKSIKNSLSNISNLSNIRGVNFAYPKLFDDTVNDYKLQKELDMELDKMITQINTLKMYLANNKNVIFDVISKEKYKQLIGRKSVFYTKYIQPIEVFLNQFYGDRYIDVERCRLRDNLLKQRESQESRESLKQNRVALERAQLEQARLEQARRERESDLELDQKTLKDDEIRSAEISGLVAKSESNNIVNAILEKYPGQEYTPMHEVDGGSRTNKKRNKKTNKKTNNKKRNKKTNNKKRNKKTNKVF